MCERTIFALSGFFERRVLPRSATHSLPPGIRVATNFAILRRGTGRAGRSGGGGLPPAPGRTKTQKRETAATRPFARSKPLGLRKSEAINAHRRARSKGEPLNLCALSENSPLLAPDAASTGGRATRCARGPTGGSYRYCSGARESFVSRLP